MTDAASDTVLTDGFNLVVDALKLNKITEIYGVAGIPVTDLMRLAQEKGIHYFGFRHETSAGNAAAISGYLRQWPGICMTVSAPGFLNGMVALANATTNGFPMILISGSSNRAIVDLQQGDYEELDQMNAAKPYAKAAYRVERVEDIGLGVARAIRAALSGRPGGVYLDLPAAVLPATMAADAGAASLIEVVDAAPARIPADSAITRALELLAQAKRPLVILGKGAAYARVEDDMRQFLEATGIPFLPMSMAKGLLPDDHPQSAAAARSKVLAEADVVLLAGARLNWLLGHGRAPQWAADGKLIQIDIEPTEIDSNRKIDAPIVGDLASSVSLLLKGLATVPVKAPQDWIVGIDAHKAANAAKMADRLAARPVPLNFFAALGAVNRVVKDHPEAYLVAEGANTLDVGRNLIDMARPRHRLDVGTWGVMGIGMGYSIAAAITQKAPVIAVEGDSAFGFSGMEVETICRYGLPVSVVVMNNGGIYRGDDVNRSGDGMPGVTTLSASARYDRIIEAFGGTGYNVTTAEELEAALRESVASGRPGLINVAIDIHVGTESGHLKKLNPTAAKPAS
ncbi:oxalyl-CoA decarboxylase [Gluconacetobacter sp. 1c LMG 22058]|uniref:Oxalyl-CoA decarboxylase n=1 Tax=Gluconacetobacter dulcium TaxID=2729096 RepID=A0A7W4PJP0_9PROT|nr:oxalyl-CoA decarboxylase [Gluconacetobacter dulcium]MBB2198789.1 oxalyl-CoA decarboxylase [Gluconacetobacter dulcium]